MRCDAVNVVTLLRSTCKKKIISSLICNSANKQANALKKVFDQARLLKSLKYFELLLNNYYRLWLRYDLQN